MKKFETQKDNVLNKFYFCLNFFSYRLIPCKNDVILTNHGSFFQGKILYSLAVSNF